MYVAITTKTEEFYLEAKSCRNYPAVPAQNGEPKRIKKRTIQVSNDDGTHNFDVEEGDAVYLMNDAGKTFHTIHI